MSPVISVSNLSKTYGSGFKALNGINLDIQRGEIRSESTRLNSSHSS